jgi:hypothetical protein
MHNVNNSLKRLRLSNVEWGARAMKGQETWNGAWDKYSKKT